MANFEIVQWPDMDFYRDGIPNREPHLSIKLDGEPLGHKEFFESSDKPNVVYCFHYICDHEDNGKKQQQSKHAQFSSAAPPRTIGSIFGSSTTGGRSV